MFMEMSDDSPRLSPRPVFAPESGPSNNMRFFNMQQPAFFGDYTASAYPDLSHQYQVQRSFSTPSDLYPGYPQDGGSGETRHHKFRRLPPGAGDISGASAAGVPSEDGGAERRHALLSSHTTVMPSSSSRHTAVRRKKQEP
jgi:hypothetical protein